MDDPSDARSNSRCPGQPCCFWPVVCCVRWMSIAWTSGSIPCDCVPLRRAARERDRDTHNTHSLNWRSAGCFLGKRLPRLGAAWGKKDVQLANKNPPVARSPVCLAPPRTSSESGSGSRTKVTLWSPPLTRRVRTQPSIRSLSTPRSSLPLRESPLFFSPRPSPPGHLSRLACCFGTHN